MSNPKNSTPMDKDAAARIQSDAAKTGQNADFAARAQSAADKNANEAASKK